MAGEGRGGPDAGSSGPDAGSSGPDAGSAQPMPITPASPPMARQGTRIAAVPKRLGWPAWAVAWTRIGSARLGAARFGLARLASASGAAGGASALGAKTGQSRCGGGEVESLVVGVVVAGVVRQTSTRRIPSGAISRSNLLKNSVPRVSASASRLSRSSSGSIASSDHAGWSTLSDSVFAGLTSPVIESPSSNALGPKWGG